MRPDRTTAQAPSPRRLSRDDLVNLAVEAPDTPMHVGAVLVLDGASLFTERGDFDLPRARELLAARLDDVPELRRRLRPTGRPTWVDDPGFTVERHVTHLDTPVTGETDLFRLADDLLRPPLDRDRPLWRIWFATGLPERRVGVVLAIHHALADGAATLRLLAALCDPPAAPTVDRSPAASRPARVGWIDVVRRAWRTFARSRGAPRTSLNGPIGPARRTAVVRLDLDRTRSIAHANDATVNDVVLDLVAGGLRALLGARDEAVPAVHAAIPVAGADRSRRTGNRSGLLVVRLPLEPADARRRLVAVRAATRRAKRDQLPMVAQGALIALARPGLTRYVTRHQHLTNTVVSNLVGPAARVRMCGAEVLDLVPLGALAGNLAVSFLAFSYAGRLTITVRADADRFPDLAVLADGITAAGDELTGSDELTG